MKLGHGNTDPRHAYLQQAAVELTPMAAEWLNEQLEGVLKYHGRLSEADLSKLDWPEFG
jgi:Asp-tRNA(Asn)/Glu-tRNA(Gln) amidotransferase C subunit